MIQIQNSIQIFSLYFTVLVKDSYPLRTAGIKAMPHSGFNCFCGLEHQWQLASVQSWENPQSFSLAASSDTYTKPEAYHRQLKKDNNRSV